jgi:hypothetical protein
MGTFGNVLLSLVRPAKGVDGAASVLKWLWIPLAVILLGSVAVKTLVSTPMSIEASKEVAKAELRKQAASMSDAERKDFEAATKDAEANMSSDAGSAIVSTSAMVFAVLGATMALFYIATFFFVAAKTWANPVAYSTMLSIAGLSLVPHALRNIVQTIYMSATGVWLQHPGLGAMVAPASPTDPPGLLYAVLSQVDLWIVWGLAILFGALLSETVGIGRKRAVTGMVTFIAITGILQAIPTLITGVFMGAAG